jgi:hypothetical protein
MRDTSVGQTQVPDGLIAAMSRLMDVLAEMYDDPGDAPEPLRGALADAIEAWMDAEVEPL